MHHVRCLTGFLIHLWISNQVFLIDDSHLNRDGTYTFASNLIDFLNDFKFNKSIWLTEDDNTIGGTDKCKQSFDSSDEVKHNNNIDLYY